MAKFLESGLAATCLQTCRDQMAADLDRLQKSVSVNVVTIRKLTSCIEELDEARNLLVRS